MAYSFVQYTGDGANKLFTIPFPYLERSHVEVYVSGALQTVDTHYTFISDSQIQFVNAPANGAPVVLRRASNRQARLVDYQNSAKLTEAVLDRDSNQVFFVAQEAFDYADNSIGLDTDANWDALNKRIKNVVTTINLGDAANVGYVNTQIAASEANSLRRHVSGLYWEAAGLKIINVIDPENPQEAATKAYVDSAVSSAINALPISDVAGNVDAEGRRVTNVAPALDANDAVTKAQLDAVVLGAGSVPPPNNPGDNGKFLQANNGNYSWQLVGNFLPLSGGTLTGDLKIDKSGVGSIFFGPAGAPVGQIHMQSDSVNMGTFGSAAINFFTNNSTHLTIDASGNLIHSGPTPSVSNHLVTKGWTEGQFLPKTGGTLSGGVTISNGSSGTLGLGPSGGHIYGDNNIVQVGSATGLNIYLVNNNLVRLHVDPAGNLIHASGPAPTASNHLVTKGYVDSADSGLWGAIAGKAAAGHGFSWALMWTGSDNDHNLLASWGSGVYLVVGPSGRRVVFTTGDGSTLDVGAGAADPNHVYGGDIIAGEDFTAVYKLSKS